MRTLLFVGIAFFCAAQAASANFTGHWEGSGTATESSAVTNCEILVEVNQLTSTFGMSNGNIDCGAAGEMNTPTIELRIRNGGLYYSILRVGSITDGYFVIEGERPEYGWNKVQGWIVAPNTMRYYHENRKNGRTRVLDAVLNR